MAAAALILVVLVLFLSIATALLLHSWGAEQSRHQARILDPHTPTVAYAIPNGIDPVAVKLAVRQAGFDSVVHRVGNAECLLVECDETDRARLRTVIESMHLHDFDGSELILDNVVFEDER